MKIMKNLSTKIFNTDYGYSGLHLIERDRVLNTI